MIAYVGNVSNDEAEWAFSSFAIDEQSGGFALLQTLSIERPRSIAISTSSDCLYLASDVFLRDDVPGGIIYAYAVDSTSGQLSMINRRILPFAGVAYLEIDRSGNFLFAASTSGGGVLVLPIDSSGALNEPSSIHRHPGAALVPFGASGRAAEKPVGACQPHSIGADPTNRLVIVPDLSADRIVLYRFDEEYGRLDVLENDIKCPANSGPRDFAFHPTKQLVFVINEIAPTITVLQYDADAFEVAQVGTVRTVPDDFGESNMGSDIVLSKDGRFLYCTNRGHDSVALFSISDVAPYLHAVGWYPTAGKAPRGLALSPDGAFLFVANSQSKSKSVVSFAVDQESGALTLTGNTADMSQPCGIATI